MIFLLLGLCLGISTFLQILGLRFNPYLTFSLWIAANCLDVHSTFFFLKYGGKEGNPIVAFLFKKIGPVKSAALFKMPLAFIFGLLFISSDGSNILIMTWCIMYVYIVIKNYSIGFRLKKLANDPP